MTIVEGGDEISQLWGVITELSEQLNQNRNLSVALFGAAGKVKSQALHSQTGFVLRRFNMDKSKEAYDAELERMNAAIALENQTLQHDNKQLNTLIKEYEQTMDTLMTQFRNKAQDVQEHELSLIKEYETKLLALEETNATRDLGTSTAISDSLARISRLLRRCLRAQGGECVFEAAESGAADEELEEVTRSIYEREPWLSQDATQAERALEREIELARLEKENEELRRMLGLRPGQ
ncbi:hypothetical protein E1B28_012542 [Marasmius oreades]|uniref:Suppressor of IKBKE 1 n=1 Tax=Marasmius oreades TaxID=181124 RepID=A0A9P7UQ13_9AGAR|nr:uncharacterized protein E1B28_012542 [Marasmius oreades]KAG7088561.1 hypothetical protein E1B28_012542 [Marasmius oreades]